jgi:peptide/nickel transport system substrate-binding protein
MSHRHAAPPQHVIPRPFVVIIALLGIAIVLAGGYWWLGGDEPGAGPASSTEALPTTAWDRAQAASVTAGGRLRLAVSAWPGNLNPVQADGAGASTAQVLAPTTGSPVRITTDGGWRVDSDYARSVDVIDKKPLTVRVRLNRDAVWQDGTPITAKDMTTFQRAMSGDVKSLEVASTDGFDDIASVKRGGDRFEYTVTFSSARSDWPKYIYPRLPADLSAKPKAFNRGFRSKAVPSNGPFVVASVDQKTGTITEERNPRWWGRTPRLERVVWRIADPSVQAKAFGAGELDAASIDGSTYDEVADQGSVQRAAGGTWSHLTLNGGRGPLKDVDVRRAVAAAIDRDALASMAGKGVGAPGRTAGSVLLVPGQRGYRDAAARELPSGQDEARALLEKAGYRQVDGKATRKGKPLTLTLPVPSDTPTSKARVKAIAGDLQAAGITVKTPMVNAARFFRDRVVPLDFDLVTFTWPASPFPVEAAERRFRPIDSPQNYTGVTDKKLNGRWDDAAGALDEDERADLVHDLDARLMRQAVVVPLSMLPDVVVVRRGLVNYGASTFEQPDFTIVGFRAKK